MEGGCCCATHPAIHSRRRRGASAACAAREEGVGVIVPGARAVREVVGDTRSVQKYKYNCRKYPRNIFVSPTSGTHTSCPRATCRASPTHCILHSAARPRKHRGRLPASSFPRTTSRTKRKEKVSSDAKISFGPKATASEPPSTGLVPTRRLEATHPHTRTDPRQ